MTTSKAPSDQNGIRLTPVDFDPFAQATDQIATVALSEAQREIWTAVQMSPEASCAYNMSFALRLVGAASVEDLRSSIQHLFDRHEALRLAFDPSGAWQVAKPPYPVDIPIVDLSGLPLVQREAALDAIFTEEVEKPLNLGTGLPARVRIIVEAANQCLVVLTAHHIVFDGWSVSIFFQELAFIYAAARRREVPTLPPAEPFSQFVLREHRAEAREKAMQAHAYWQTRFKGTVPILDLPLDRPRPPVKTYRGAVETLGVDASLSASLRRNSGQQGSTIVGFFLAAFQVLLHRLSGQPDVVIGLPVSVRDVTDRQTLVGHATNLLPIRIQSDGQASFATHLRAVRAVLLDAIEHQEVSFGSLVHRLDLPWDPSRTPLVAATFILDRGRVAPEFVDAKATIFRLPRRHLNFDLEMYASDTGREFVLECGYNPDLWTASTIRRWLRHYIQLLSGAVADCNTPLNRLPLLTDAERHQFQVAWNSTGSDYPREKCIQELFESQVARTPHRPAVKVGSAVLSYKELDTRAARVAQVLRSRGVGRGQRVGLCLERGADMVAVTLGILKASAAYVPFDPVFPAERLHFMAEDARLTLLVSTSALADSLGLPRERQLLLDTDAAVLASQSGQRLGPDAARDARPEDPAYVIYTSGSTGTPKGVVVPHRAVVNFLASMAREPGLAADDVLLAVTTLSFDIAVLELLLPLAVGATVVIASREEAMDGYALNAVLEHQHATVMQATPVTWRLLLETGWKGGKGFKALVGGETLPKDLADQLIAQGVELWNMYGPTETTVWSTCSRIDDTANGISIGKPIANTTVYILDAQKDPCPVGIPGELHIGGDGVTLGYWNRPELTAQSFIPDPFAATSGARLYCTGDRARWREDGTIEHLGRLDFQVKVRGYRIELGEIEIGIARHKAIREAVVVVRDDVPGDPRLVAYVVAQDPPQDLVGQLRARLRAGLPEYMVPSAFVVLDSLPLTANGKIDRRLLPAPDLSETAHATAPVLPRTETETILVGIWAEVLGLGPLGTEENFFELGGHSLPAMRVISLVRQRFSLELPLRDFFTTPTISGLAARIEALRGDPLLPAKIDVALESSSSRPAGLIGNREETTL